MDARQFARRQPDRPGLDRSGPATVLDMGAELDGLAAIAGRVLVGDVLGDVAQALTLPAHAGGEDGEGVGELDHAHPRPRLARRRSSELR